MAEEKEKFLPPVDPQMYRRAAGAIAKGVTIIASGQGKDMRAMTASAVISVSLKPLLNLFCVSKKANLVETLEREQGFSVNILRHDQAHLSDYFAARWSAEAPPHFEFVPWHGGPRLKGCAASIGCQLHAMQEGGDHWIVIGRVIAVHLSEGPVDPLLFFQGRYRTLAP